MIEETTNLDPETRAALLDRLPCGVALLNRDLVFQLVNRHLEGRLGAPRDQVVGQPAKLVMPAASWPTAEALMGRAFDGESVSHDVEFAGGGGPGVWMSVTYGPQRDPKGRIVGVRMTALDITREEAGARSTDQHEMREVQSIARIGSYRNDLRAGTWTASEGFCRIFGFEPGGVYTTEEFQQIVHPADFDRVMAYFGDCIAEHRPFDAEYRCIKRDTGEVIHVRSTSQVFYDDDGTPVRIQGIKQDITQRKALEQQMYAAQRLESVGRLAGGIAHDFNNLLTAILGFAELIADDLGSDNPNSSMLGQVVLAADRASELTAQLLAFSRRRMVQPAIVDLNDTVAGVDKILRRLLGEDIDFSTKLQDQLWTARIDPGAIEQVVINLAVNARDAMPTGGKLTLETANRTFDHPVDLPTALTLAPGDYVEITVTDTGHGMDQATQDQIFEPFFTTKAEGEGTGLGLATCYGLLAQAGGGISVYSEPGLGTCFRAYLPRVDGSPEQRPDPTAATNAGGDETILVAEDDDQVRALVTTVLQQLGYRVLAARDAETALDLLARSGPVHLLLTDVVLPGRSGAQLAEDFRRQTDGGPVLFTSGYTTHAMLHRGEIPTGTELMQKPFSPARLAARVRAALDADRNEPPQH